jgi:hypothetical protein
MESKLKACPFLLLSKTIKKFAHDFSKIMTTPASYSRGGNLAVLIGNLEAETELLKERMRECDWNRRAESKEGK